MIYLISNTPFDDESVEQISLCDIKFNKFNIDLSEFDALIVTSKNGINSLKFNSITLADILVFAIGKATALSCKEFGFTQIYEAQNSHGSEFGAEILEKLYGKRILFIKAKETISNLDIYFNQNGIDISVIGDCKKHQLACKIIFKIWMFNITDVIRSNVQKNAIVKMNAAYTMIFQSLARYFNDHGMQAAFDCFV